MLVGAASAAPAGEACIEHYPDAMIRLMAQSSPDTQVAPPLPSLDDGDHERFSPYVIGGGEAIMKSAITGEPVVAVCGKTWVPSRDPKKYPVCPTCEEIQAGRDPELIED